MRSTKAKYRSFRRPGGAPNYLTLRFALWLSFFFAISAVALPQKLGDLDEDGKATVFDIVRLVNHINRTVLLTNDLAFFADVNQDGFANEADVALVSAAILGLTPLPDLPPNGIRETSPYNGESSVAVTRETVLRFVRPLAAATIINTNQLYAEFGGRRFLSRVELSTDRRTVTLFYLEPLPGSARVRVTFKGDGITDTLGRPMDADGDGVAGGAATIDFETLSLTPIAGTAVIGQVFASELVAGPGNTTNSMNKPLAGVQISVQGRESTMWTLTDAQGNFRLEPAPAGKFFVLIDGRTATNGVPAGAYYPFVGKAWEGVAGQTTLAGGTGQIYLPLIVPGTLQTISPTNDTRIVFPTTVVQKNPELDGVEIMVPANSLFSENGTRGGKVGIAPVPPDRLPEKLPPGLNFPLVITVQTDGPGNFDRPVPVRFPNLPDPVTGQKLPPGAKSALWSFNHDTGQWEVIGPMTVSADGRFVESDPGVGILQPGWHGTTPGGQMKTPPNEDCPGFGWGDAWDVAKAGVDCVKNMTRALQALGAVFDVISDIKTIANSIKQFRDDYAAGRVTKDTIKAGLEALKAPKNSAVSVFEAFTASNPVSKAIDAAKCASGIVKVVVEKICNNSKCIGRLVEAVCTGAVSAVGLVDALIQKASDLEKSIRSAPLAAVCLSFDAAIAGLSFNTPVAQNSVPRNAAVDPKVLALLDQVLTDAAKFEVDIKPAIETQQSLGALSDMIGKLQNNEISSLVSQSGGYLNSYYRLTVGDNVLRGKANSQGQLLLRVAPNSAYRLEILNLAVNGLAVSEGVTPENGRTATFAPFKIRFLDEEPDTDKDGLADIAEPIIGTNPANTDTDGDGILDGAEILQGSDPLDNVAVRTGIIHTADTPGNAVDICAINDIAVVADSSAGVTVFNIFSGLTPTVIARVDTPGNARAVSCSGNLIAVADDTAGLAIIDISDPPAARIIHQINLGSAAQSVTTAGNIAFVGLASGQLVSVEMVSGSVLDRLNLSTAVQDVTLGGDYVYALTVDKLHVVSLLDGLLKLESSVTSPFVAGPNKRLFVGGGIAYAVHGKGYNTFNLANPTQPVLIRASNTTQFGWKQIVLNGSGLGVAAVDPNQALDGVNDVSLYNVTDPAKTDAFVTTFPTPGIAFAVSIYNGLAYVADGAFGMEVINYLAFDNRGVAPTISLSTSFTTGQAEEGKLLRVTANVSDDVQVRNVEFYVDGVKVLTDGNFPFEHRFVTPLITAGKNSFLLRAKATDTGGNSTWSDEMVLTLVPDATPPRVTRVSPANGSILGSVTAVSAYFNEPIDPSTLSASAFRLTSAGPDGIIGNADDLVITNGAVSYRDSLNAAFITFTVALPPGFYQAIIGSPVSDFAGNAITTPYRWNFRVFDKVDSDNDGVPDELEALLGLNPFNRDSNGNGISDGDEDFDRDGLSNAGEIIMGTDPMKADTNGNGILDGNEDRDGDGLSDAEEIRRGTNPFAADTDGDGWNDEAEVTAGSDPLNPNSKPKLFIRAQPPVSVALPSTATAGGLGAGLTVARPSVSVTLPAPMVSGGFGVGITIAHPPVWVSLPAATINNGFGAGLTVAKPPVSVTLPSPMIQGGFGTGTTVAKPPVKVEFR